MIVNNVHAMMHVSRRLACSPAGGGSYWYRMIPAVAWWLWLALLCRTKAPRVRAGEGCAGGVCFQGDATAGWGGVRSRGEDLRAGAGGERVSLGRACRRRGITVRRVGWGRGTSCPAWRRRSACPGRWPLSSRTYDAACQTGMVHHQTEQ